VLESASVSSLSSTRARLSALLGDRRRLVAGLAVASICSGFAEAATLAVGAQVAATLVSGAGRVQASIGPVHIDAGVETLIAIAFGLTLVRLACQVPISVLPARIGADVQAGLRRRLFDAFSRASWDAQAATSRAICRRR
jgi:ATP-binding cassette subfamily B protein/subfamily B ATP-binding cassette protein MsbA